VVGLRDFDIRLADCDCQYDHSVVGCGDIGDADSVWWPFSRLIVCLGRRIREIINASLRGRSCSCRCSRLGGG